MKFLQTFEAFAVKFPMSASSYDLRTEIENFCREFGNISGGQKSYYKDILSNPLPLEDCWQAYTDPIDADKFESALNALPIIEINAKIDDLSVKEDYSSHGYDAAFIKIDQIWFIGFSEGYGYWRYIYCVGDVDAVVNNIDFKIASQKELKGLEKTGVFN